MSNQNAPILIMEASNQPYLSLGCKFGGIKAFGHEYLYIPPKDAFLRKDYVKEYSKHINKEKKSWDSFVEKIKAI
jgi:hypothetical protein